MVSLGRVGELSGHGPIQATAQDGAVLGHLPAAPVGDAEIGHAEVLEIEAATAVSQCEVADRSGSELLEIEHRARFVGAGMALLETRCVPDVPGVREDAQRWMQLTDIELVGDFEGVRPRTSGWPGSVSSTR